MDDNIPHTVEVKATDSSSSLGVASRLPSPREMPRQFAPLLRNAWYVLATRQDVDRTLKSILVLGDPLVYYRAEDGTPRVFDNRCPHRMFPLSKSHLIGDTIRCGYHGFTFDQAGQCTFVPGSPHKPNFALRRYPAVERGPWLWVWMGDETAADPEDIPLQDFVVDKLSSFQGHVLNECNYMLVIENLLDLTHIHYLHGPVAADQAYADEPSQVFEVEGGVGTRKITERTRASNLGEWCGDDPDRLIWKEEENRVIGPSLVDYVGTMLPVDRPDEPLRMKSMRVLHAITPAGLYQTHQFFYFSFGTPLQISPDEAQNIIINQIFVQDLEAVVYQMEAIMNDRRGEIVERRMLGDMPAMQMHRKLNRRAVEEAAATV